MAQLSFSFSIVLEKGSKRVTSGTPAHLQVALAGQ
jgi:hypothetical protein